MGPHGQGGLTVHPKTHWIDDAAGYGSVEYRPIEASVLDGFEQVRLFDRLAAGKVGDGSGDFQYAIIGPRGE